jgi:hypothetical protein
MLPGAGVRRVRCTGFGPFGSGSGSGRSLPMPLFKPFEAIGECGGALRHPDKTRLPSSPPRCTGCRWEECEGTRAYLER